MAEITGHPQQSATSLGFGSERNTSYAISSFPRGVVLQGLRCGIQRKCPHASWHLGLQPKDLRVSLYSPQISLHRYPAAGVSSDTHCYLSNTYLPITYSSEPSAGVSKSPVTKPLRRQLWHGGKNRFTVQSLLLFWEKHLVS